MKIVFLGTPDFAVPTLEKLGEAGHEIALVVSQPDRRSGRGLNVRPTPVKQKASELGFAVYQPEDVNSRESLEKIKSLSPDVIIVTAFGQYIRKELRKIAPFGCINLHSSMLPQLRGAAPIQRAIMEGYKTTGVTIMKIERKMDAGDMFLSGKVDIGERETAGELHDRLKIMGASLVAKTLEKLAEDKITPSAQNDSEATYAPKIEQRERKIDWTRPAATIDRQIRGLSPSPGAFTFFKNRRLALLRSFVAKGQPANARPAKIVEISRDSLKVGAGGGTLTVCEVKPEGKKRMGAGDWARGMRITENQRFDS